MTRILAITTFLTIIATAGCSAGKTQAAFLNATPLTTRYTWCFHVSVRSRPGSYGLALPFATANVNAMAH